MSQRLLKTRPVQGSEWMILVRDYQINVTAYEFAVGSLYGTCGHWGEQVFLSDVAVADILHIKRETAAKARKGLLAKGLIEDIGQHGTQPQQREYRLTVPVEMPPRRKVRGDVPETGTPCPPNGHPHVPETGTGVSPDRAQHLEVELEEELEIINITPDDDGRQASSDQGQGQNPRPPGADDPDDDRPWVDWDDPDDGGSIAADLGVPVESIGQPFRAWLEEYLTSVEFDPGMKADWPAFSASIKKAAGRPSPVGYLKTILPGHVATARMKREQAAVEDRAEREQAAEDQAAQERAERELWTSTESMRDKILETITGSVPPSVRPMGSVYVRPTRDAPDLQDVWYNPEFMVCFPHSRHSPGPDWRMGHLATSQWNKVVAKEKIPLRQDG